ncbi:hypothetical protein [Staphylococcus intermedius]|uniref:Membrane protein n=1 Tax=Staphylococcus intermedius NCTC 11048 TaxID=1141106 RepID=A0A380G613_STAIN|nr:hypothetical protein [Staphylococcus intermedius]PCF63763.1 hypothetical protein B5C04_07225 [Staphylococcus intermedius]PCF78478.1 hypothetical protein B4W74_07575 [Staphylococcus intermedius]PCF79452.1 hypothetical protein B4W70_07215 [Staphylococcus intermedius]PCF86812.1 hypothetical protein B4W76_07090 [Staphylococcus intermedius]PCF89892.1 hypothetical protein B4W75_03335 [Staphylococcus intermedius]
MSLEMILFFIVAPLIIIVGNLVLAPRFQKHIPMRIHVLSTVTGLIVYAVLASIMYYFFLQGKI